MKKHLLFLFLLLQVNSLFGQHEADRWYFGVNAGMNFNSGSPIAIPGALVTNEGTTSASDTMGNLLFYSDGMTVWNKNNAIMPNGTGLFGAISSTVSGLAVPYPDNSNLYYLFTMDESTGPNGFCYSIIDMSLQSNTGDVTIKNVPVKFDVTEKIAAVKQLGTDNFWITIHEWGTDAFYSYLVNAAGFQSLPVISHSGMVHTIDALEQNKYGQMKFNSCGTKIALGIGYLDTVQVFDFDPATAAVSNPVTLPMYNHVYGVEFSQDGNYLYVTSYNINGEYSVLTQFDLTAGNEAAIIASQTAINVFYSPTSFYYAIQLATDAKIYLCKSFSQFLGVINDPSVPGSGCNYNDFGIDLDPSLNGNISALGLPSFVQSYFKGEINCVEPTGINQIKTDEYKIRVLQNPVSDEFVLQLPTAKEVESISVFDNAGRLIERSNEINSPIFKFGKSYPPGIYFMRAEMYTNNQVVKVIKL